MRRFQVVSVRTALLTTALLVMVSASACSNATPTQEAADSEISGEEFEVLMDLDPSNFDDPTNIDNEWWPLKPGTQYIYEGFTVENGEKTPHRIIFTVTDLTKVIDGVQAVVIFDTDYSDNQLEE